MKRKFGLSFAAAAIFLASYFSSFNVYTESHLGNSDEVYYNYGNIDGAIDVPTIFVQDSGFVNDKSFPLVVSDAVAYVPVEIFLGFPGIEVSYAENDNDFYIQNKNLGLYISFDISGGYAISESFGVQNLEARIYNKTIYVPADDTSRSLGLSYSIYDNYTKGLYCVRVYDSSATKSFEAIIDEYLSKFVAYNPETPPPTIDVDKGDVEEDDGKKEEESSSESGSETVKPPVFDPEYQERQEEIKDEKIEEEKEAARSELVIGRRNIYLAFTSSPNENTEDILDSLASYNAKAIFFCNAESMLKYPSLVRRIIVEGHSIGICPSEDILPARVIPAKDAHEEHVPLQPTQYDTDTVIEDLEKSQRVLYQLTKLRSRLLYTPQSVFDSIDAGRIYNEYGETCVTPNFETTDYTGATRVRISADVIDTLWVMQTQNGVGNAVVLFNSTEKSAQAAERIMEFASARPQVRINRLSEGTDISFLGKDF